MPLLDLSLVTETLVKLIDESIKASPAWPLGQVPNVTGMPPDRLDGDNTVGVYLYHLAEDAAYKNTVWPGRPQPPMRFTPMGLNLYYVVSAHSALTDSLGPYREQLLMGLSVKALHDWPVIDDATVVNGVSILHANLRDGHNLLRVELRHLSPSEAVSYWTAGSQPLRLSAYYEARVVLLEPDEPATGGGRVMQYGIQTFVGGQPRLETSRNRVTFRIPGEATDRVVEAQPAAASPGVEIAFLGVDLVGDAIGLAIRAQSWTDAVPLDAAWGVVAGVDRVFATVQRQVDGRAVLPGPYTAVAQVTRTFPLPDGSTRTIEQQSNQTPFTIVPAVDTISAAVNGVITVTGGVFADPALPPGAVVVYLADHRLIAGTAGALAPGEVAVVDASTLELRLTADATSGHALPLRIVINGAESPPRWVEVP